MSSRSVEQRNTAILQAQIPTLFYTATRRRMLEVAARKPRRGFRKETSGFSFLHPEPRRLKPQLPEPLRWGHYGYPGHQEDRYPQCSLS
jgi:hypothetical protein